ncbi:MAG: hypothetical protein V4696_10115 [Pseudomonadota bacterium]
MSNHLISLAYKRDLRTSMRKAVLVLMADKASDDGSGIWAAKQTMADELCCSKQTVIDTIKGFVAEGIVSERGQRKSPNGYTVEYHLNVAVVEALPLVKCHADKGSRKLTGQPAGPVKEIDPTSQPAGPEPSLNPSPSVVSNETTPPTAEIQKVKPEQVIEAWNAMAETTGVHKARLTPDRRKKLATFIKRNPIEDITEAIWSVPRSPFLCGENDRGWKAGIDFMLQPSSFTRMIEGTYGQ